MNIIDEILSRREFADEPPVLVDIGASENIHRNWKRIARYSLCVAFDADEREFQYIKEESGKFRKLYIYNCIVSDTASEHSDFYLTKSPYCSSLLHPDNEKLKDLAYSSLFQVEKVAAIKTAALPDVLKELGIESVDWFKTDSQGIDLRLFRSLGPEKINRVLAAEFEPGIIDAYIGENKLHEVLSYMDETNSFWMADVIVKGSPRIPESVLAGLYPNKKMRKLAMFSLKEAPGWGELTYLNKFASGGQYSKRDYLLGWVFATVLKHHGFAYTLALRAKESFSDPYFEKLMKHSRTSIRREIIKLKFAVAIVTKISKMLNLTN
ncbi:MAG: hypothetical protein ACM3SM_06960 [Bacteroidota bacterium]